MPGIDEKARHGGGAHDRRAIRGHRPEAAPEGGLAGASCSREQVRDRMLERRAARAWQGEVEARDLGRAAHPDPVSQPRDGDLVGLVHHRGHRRGSLVRDRHRQRVALHGVDRDVDAREAPAGAASSSRQQRRQRRRAEALQPCERPTPCRLPERGVDRHAVAEVDGAGRERRELLGEQAAVACLVARKPQAPDDLVAHARQGRFGGDAPRRRKDREFDAELLQDLDVADDPVELLLRPEQLQGALGPLVIFDAGGRSQVAQAVAAVFRDRHHARLVHRIALTTCSSTASSAAMTTSRDRTGDGSASGPCFIRSHLIAFSGTPGPGPRRRVAGRHLSGVGIAGFKRGAGLAVEHGDLMARASQIPGRGHADDPASYDDDSHCRLPQTRDGMPRGSGDGFRLS